MQRKVSEAKKDTSLKWQEDRAKKEKAALDARVKARAYLLSTGEGVTSIHDTEKLLGEAIAKKIRESAIDSKDNTLEEVRKRSVLKRQIERNKLELKAQEDIVHAKRCKQLNNLEKLSSNWVKVPDGAGKFYYWNTKTQETTWEKPEMSLENTEEYKSEKPQGEVFESRSVDANSVDLTELESGWKHVKHAATGQDFWIHDETKERRRMPPTSTAP